MLPRIYIDFETQSSEDITIIGAYKYIWHPWTRMTHMSFSYRPNDPEPFTHEPTPEEQSSGIYRLPKEFPHGPFILVAHNAPFDKWCFERFFNQSIPWSRVDCTSNRCRFYGLPGSLEGALMALGLTVQKDMEGSQQMKILMRPYKWVDGLPVFYDRTTATGSQLMDRVSRYGAVDIKGLIELDKTIPPLPDSEKYVQILHWASNEQGVRGAVDAAKRVNELGEEYKARGAVELSKITDGKIQKPTQVTALKKWVEEKLNRKLPGLDANVIEALLKEDLPKDVEAAVKLRALHSQMASSKLKSMVDRECRGMLPDLMMYSGAHTHRWSSYGFQIHNLAKPDKGYTIEKACEFIERVKQGANLDELEKEFGDFNNFVSNSIRAFILPRNKGEVIASVDASAIEARGIAYLAEENSILNIYREGGDTYKANYADVSGISYDDVTSDQRQVGKVMQLSLGFGGGVDALLGMARLYRVDMRAFVYDRFVATSGDDFRNALQEAMKYANHQERDLAAYRGLVGNPRWYMDETKRKACDVLRARFWWSIQDVRNKGMDLKDLPSIMPRDAYILFTDDLINNLIATWRKRYPNIVDLWKALQSGAVSCVQTGQPVQVNRHLSFKMRGKFLVLELPSGNGLYYFRPHVSGKVISYASQKNKGALVLWDKMNHGGLWAENATQSFCRDIFAHHMVDIYKNTRQIMYFHVHDELAYSVQEDQAKAFKTRVEELMSIPPPFASDMPLKAEGHIAPCYWKH